MSELVRVAVCNHEVQANLLEQMLSDQGIDCLVQRSPDMDVPEMLVAGKRQILVRADRAEEARAFLASLEDESEEGDNDFVDYRLHSQGQMKVVAGLLLALIVIIIVARLFA